MHVRARRYDYRLQWDALSKRWQIANRGSREHQSTGSKRCIFLFWHEYIFPLLPLGAGAPLTLLVSRHRDAEWLNQAAARFGYSMVRGSTARGGTAAIRQLKKQCDSQSLVVTPDGPRGPRREMGEGPIFLASLLGIPIIPVGVGCNRPHRLRTWDRMAIPRIGSRVRIVAGPQFHIPRKQRAHLDAFRQTICNCLHQLTHVAEQWSADNRAFRNQTAFSGWSFNCGLMEFLSNHAVNPPPTPPLGIEQRRAA